MCSLISGTAPSITGHGLKEVKQGRIPYRGAVPAAAWTPPTRRRVRAMRDRLRAVYGIPRMAPHGDPLAELVLTVLSQSTNDRNRDVAYLRLRTRLGRAGIDFFEAVRDAPLEVVEEAIRPGGISKVKSESHPADSACDLRRPLAGTQPGGLGRSGG